jgi:N-acetyl-beta-hexosaminidase
MSQNILPTPLIQKDLDSGFIFKQELKIGYEQDCINTAQYLLEKLNKYVEIKYVKPIQADLVLSLNANDINLGEEGYILRINNKIQILANTEAGLFYGIQSLLQLLPVAVQAGGDYSLRGTALKGIEVKDKPKYAWRSFMLDSGRQYQSPEFIKRYLNYMAMLKMNVFHWHLSEGQGWRIEIKKYPKLTEIGSRVATGKEQQGYYTHEDIKDIVAFAKKLHINVVPEIDVPGHSEAALTAYPEMTCFKEAPESVMAFSPILFCGGREATYSFLQDILDEVCELFPSKYIHLGGDEAPKSNWDKCPDCQKRIQEEQLKNSHDLQLYFSSRLATYLKTKDKKAIFWGDVVYHEGTALPDNVIVNWWNSRGHKDQALNNAIKRGHQIICNTNNYSYLNFPLVPWSKYAKNRTFDLKTTYEQNSGDLSNPHELVLGMGCSLWTDWYVQEHMIDRRVFPRIYSLSEQMWRIGERLSFEDFYAKIKGKYALLEALGIDYGPAMLEEMPNDYKWE